MKEITIVLPTKNEEEALPKILPLLRDYNVIVVDDSDNDLTRQVAEKIGGCVFLKGVGNESPSIKHALETIVKDKLPFPTKYCVLMDCDGSHDAAIISQMIEDLENGKDLISGSRYCEGGNEGSSNAFSKAGNLFARIVLGTKTKDLTGRYVAADPQLLLKCCEWRGRGEDSVELIFHAEKRGYEIKEIPFVYKDRVGGKTKTSIPKYLIKYFFKVLSLKFGDGRLYSRKYISRAFTKDFIGDKPVKSNIWIDIIYLMQFPAVFILSLPCYIPVVDQIIETIVRGWTRGMLGFLMRGIYWKTKFGYMGEDVFIDMHSSFFGASNMRIGNNTHVDTGCTFTCAEGKMRIGDDVHIASDTIINGKPFVIIGDGVGISAGCKIYGSTQMIRNDKGERVSGSPMMPYDQQYVKKVGIVIEDYSFVGADCVILPGAHMGTWSVLGACSLLQTKIPFGEVFVGSPARGVKWFR